MGGLAGYLTGVGVWAFRPTARLATEALGLLPNASWMWFIVGLVGAMLTAAGPVVVAAYLGVGSPSGGLADGREIARRDVGV